MIMIHRQEPTHTHAHSHTHTAAKDRIHPVCYPSDRIGWWGGGEGGMQFVVFCLLK